ncbi:kinetochore Sim4 complex subunit FTA2-domain-containing protein [Chaetomium sp. MPI-CAGE-AT-0009]|nr:kinetochore Sim4 complex subunit FTA2-domain-containing protein [Chaetomium sp. MPI-CAGE-AT-0009]
MGNLNLGGPALSPAPARPSTPSSGLSRPSTQPAKPLPQVPGPKLAPFTPTGRADIQFITQLGDPDSNKDGRVWEVRINGSGPHYALKMFYFSSATYISQTSAGKISHELASPQLYFDYFDAFGCECRAYGRLKEESREDLAVPAHGYLLLTPKQEATITKMMAELNPTDSDLDGGPWCRSEETRHLPIRAIVKELATDPDHFRPSHVTNMWSDLQDFHKLGILVRDITVFNYMGGKLIDLSRSWAWPHPGLIYSEEAEIARERRSDPHYLRTIIIEFGYGERWDWDTVEIPDELTKCDLGREIDKYDFDPRQYDWLKWEENPAEAATFIAENCSLRDTSDW